MEKFVWDESLKTGHRMIDVQHKELIAAFNDLGEAIEKGEGPTAIKKILTFLKYYAEWHFEHEENCAFKHKCPIADVNKQAHQQFLQTVGTLNEEYRQSGSSEIVAKKIHTELLNWLLSHIRGIDVQIAQQIQ